MTSGKIAVNDEWRASEVERLLRAQGLVEPLDTSSPGDVRAWAAWDVAGAAEGAFHVRLDPRKFGEADRSGWQERLGDGYDAPGLTADSHLTRYLWLMRGSARAGTLALPFSGAGRIELPIWSLYVLPVERKNGIATRLLAASYEAAIACGFAGMSLETHWVWQRAVRFYLGRRMWVVGWKRAVTFASRPSLPRYEIVERGDELALTVGGIDGWRAQRRRERLVLEPGDAARDPGVRVYGHATLAVALALRGWPLVRSEGAWARRLSSADLGEVEGLAHKIQRFESLARSNGWDVRTPAIPGLPDD